MKSDPIAPSSANKDGPAHELPATDVAKFAHDRSTELPLEQAADVPADEKVVTPSDPEFEAQMKAARQVMVDYRDTLRALAKR